VVEAVATGTRQVGALLVNSRDGSVAVNASKLDAPTQAYDADFGWIDYKTGRLSICFAKRNLVSADALETRLEVRYPPEHFLNTFWTNSAEFYEKLAKYVALWPNDALQTEKLTVSLPAARSHSLWASFAYISHSGTEASIDFYHMSTASLARYTQVKSTDGLRLVPITRVQMTTFELFHLFERAQSVIEQLEKDVPLVHRQTAPKGTTD
jgi:hypothetical protein